MSPALTYRTCTAHDGAESVERNTSAITRNVTMANIRSVSVIPSAVGNGRCSRRRRSSTYST